MPFHFFKIRICIYFVVLFLRKNSWLLNTLSTPNAPQALLMQIQLYANICNPQIFQKISFLTWVTAVEHMEYEGKHLSELFLPAKSPSHKWSTWGGGQHGLPAFLRLTGWSRGWRRFLSGPQLYHQAQPEDTSASLTSGHTGWLVNGILSLNQSITLTETALKRYWKCFKCIF